jgi:hypothetical protein
VVITFGVTSYAQVGLNNPNPDPSSILDLKSTDKGLLIPRMTTGERNAMAIGTPTPAKGLLVFDTSLNRIYFWDGVKWRGANVVVADSTGANEVLRVGTRMSVGSGYTASQPASNGLLVEGNTGIGTNNPGSDRLSVDGTTKLNGNTSVTGNVTVSGTTTTNTANITGTLTAGNIANTGTNSNGPVPKGGIIMWSGSTANIPSGWALCDGTNGTPNLQDRFVVGTGSTYAVNAIGGSATHNHTTGTAGDHNHALSSTSNGGNTGGITNYDPTKGTFHSKGYYAEDDNQGWHAHSFLQTGYNSGYGEGNHAHLLHGNTANGGNHTHTVSSANNLPPYYSLAFIMKL